MSLFSRIRSLFIKTPAPRPGDGVEGRLFRYTFPDNWKVKMAGCVYNTTEDGTPTSLRALLWHVTDHYGCSNVFYKTPPMQGGAMMRIGTEDRLADHAQEIFGLYTATLYADSAIQKRLDRLNRRVARFNEMLATWKKHHSEIH